MLLPALAGLIAPGMGSSDRPELLTCRKVKGEPVMNQSPVATLLIYTYLIRYSNMDFALMSTLTLAMLDGIIRLLVSYDIACQWIKHFAERVKSYNNSPPIDNHSPLTDNNPPPADNNPPPADNDPPPADNDLPTINNNSPHIDTSKLTYFKVAVPKFHLPGHGTDCQVRFNLAYTKWAGRMDGERIEAGWALSTPMATWTRESGPNARRGILDDHWNASNWRKVLGLREFSSLLFSFYHLTVGFRRIP